MNEEKNTIERSTIDGFLIIYNRLKTDDFRALQYGDAPDAVCRNTKGEDLNIEVTITEDRPRDLQAMLGRSDHKSIESVRQQMDRVKQGLEPVQFSSLSGNVLDQAIDRIEKKLLKRYGPHTALVVRNSSPLPWNWNDVKDQMIRRLNLKTNPFDKGIWILDYDKKNLFQMVEGAP